MLDMVLTEEKILGNSKPKTCALVNFKKLKSQNFLALGTGHGMDTKTVLNKNGHSTTSQNSSPLRVWCDGW
uniref:Uncharacterized protein n=1 Tax=Romanomermis culicivorax TaxID=13658 RepID=A0A915K9V4_ROMCU